MTTLITGVTGFVGPYLCREFTSNSDQHAILGTTRDITASEKKWARSEGIELAPLCVTDANAVEDFIKIARPDCIIHLAALSHVPTAQKVPRETWEVNCQGTMNVLEACRSHASDSLFIYIGSGDSYGRAFRREMLVSEDTPLLPENTYSASKAAAEIMVRQYGYEGLKTVCLRAFNHVGPGQRPDFVVSAFARQIAAIEAGRQDPVIRVGNLEAWRDFLDVRDVVRAYTAVIERGDDIAPGSVFNVCSGWPRQIRSILDDLLAASDAEIEVEEDPERLRPSDTPFAAGDPARLKALCGWAPEVPWERTIRDTLDYWRREAGQTG